jgi:urease accessory protein
MHQHFKEHRMRTNITRWSLALAVMAFSGMAQAHPGHGGGYLAGLTHPFTGFDHLLAMLAVGVWAAQLGGRAKWLVPASFIACMAVAASVGMSGIALPLVESGIATSVLLLGLLIAFSIKLPIVLSASIVGLFAAFHGYAHGAEMPLLSTPWVYGIGFVLSTAALHGLGLLLGQGLHKQAMWLRAVGILIVASGAWMVAVA